ncbi:xanthine dehydrogenase family protein molybdopterin-binding subunit [Halomarina salina]|uniref:Xanthine dehydrogenase family protein molybdopterin-binding subunit n=1 Tax=Halomarina salina TaxID=1872699 RepID=A0ABD5RI40_9EURY|nr:xanthine dehydrogenase family protein molybdopterin-binding subunit [Halomarina salina]
MTNESPDEPSVGRRTTRREDAALLTGDAAYTDDLTAPGAVHLAFVRSDHAHARLDGVDTSGATDLDGVVAAYTWDDLDASDAPMVLGSSGLDVDAPGHPVLARDRVRYQGQPIAAVVAEDRYVASDAVAAVDVTYNTFDATTDPAEATAEDAPTLYEAAPDNVAATGELGDREATDRAFETADHAVALDLRNNRLVANAMEPRAALARYDEAEERLTVELTSQSAHGHRRDLSRTLGVREGRIRVVAPDVGGGFGHKGHHYPGEAMTAWAARELGRPVRWTATRSENYRAGAHGRDHVTHAELAVDDGGTVRGLRAETNVGLGGYALGSSAAIQVGYGRLLSGEYRIPAIHCEARSVFTTTAPVHTYRGAGRPESIYVVERLFDAAARELDLDPVELRRRNLVGADAFPYETPVGATYDSGDYERAMDRALDAVDYSENREESRQRDDDDGRYRGVGVANYVESTGGGFESGVVRVHPDGSVAVYAGTHSHGQGHETTYAQIVADELGVDEESIEVSEGDTDSVPTGTGTFGSRSTVTGGNAVAESARAVREKARRIAAHQFEAPPDDVAYDAGEFHVTGDPSRTIPFSEVASAAYGSGLPDGVDRGLDETTFYEPEGTAYTFGTHVARVAVDPESGEVEIERYVAVDDCGPRVNPTIVEGQVHGGVAQGVGQARYEAAVYGEDGALLTDSLSRYGVPKTTQLPDVETDATETPSPTNRLGVKGIGEAGTIAAPPAVVNAVVDALSPLGVEHVDMPLTEETVWTAIRDASE